MLDKNKTIIMMSGTLHSEAVLKNIFSLDSFKTIEAETEKQGELIVKRTGLEFDCRYENLSNTPREKYLRALEACINNAKRPTVVHLTGFNDLPSEKEKEDFNLSLPTRDNLREQQNDDPLNKRVNEFKKKKFDILFTTKCSRGIDFPGETCNSIVVTRFPYPNVSSIFWKILKKTKPASYHSFYMDKANRDLLQKIYRGLRSKTDKVELLSPDIRVLNFFEKK